MSIKSKDLYTCINFTVCTEFSAEIKMATITLSLPKEFEEAKKKHSQVDWNEVIKQGILDRLKRLEKLMERGKL